MDKLQKLVTNFNREIGTLEDKSANSQKSFNLDLRRKDTMQESFNLEARDAVLIFNQSAAKPSNVYPLDQDSFDGISSGSENIEVNYTIIDLPICDYKIGCIYYTVGHTLFVKMGVSITRFK